jgi:hypothetical protein
MWTAQDRETMYHHCNVAGMQGKVQAGCLPNRLIFSVLRPIGINLVEARGIASPPAFLPLLRRLRFNRSTRYSTLPRRAGTGLRDWPLNQHRAASAFSNRKCGFGK